MRLILITLFATVTTSVLATAPPPVSVPDNGSVALLLALSCAGLAAGSRLLRKQK